MLKMFSSGKTVLFKGCGDVSDYFLKNKHIYQRLYPGKSDDELQRMALFDWNEVMPEEQIVLGSVEAEKRILKDMSDLETLSLFHKGSIAELMRIEKSMTYQISQISSFFSKENKTEQKAKAKETVKQAIDFIQPSMDALQQVQLSEQEHLSELYMLMQNDAFVKKVINKVDRKVLASTTVFDVKSKIKLRSDDIIVEYLAKKFVSKIEELRRSLEKQNFALNELLIELNKEKPSMKAIRRNGAIFRKELPSIKKQMLLFNKLERTNSSLLSKVESIRKGMEQAGFAYLDAKIGLPDLRDALYKNNNKI
ncbi:hypothetical protein ACFL96_11130 [Thermoproteota archaeon]